MSEAQRWLDPTGTGRAGADRARGGLPLGLVERARQLDLGEEQLFVAWELAGLEPGAPPARRRALATLVLASIVAHRRGSTRLPVGERDRAELRAGLAELGADGDAADAVLQLVDAVRRGELGATIGRPGDYRPLILDGEHLYHQRMHALEVRVAERLRARLDAPAVLDAAASERLVKDVLAAPPRGPSGEPLALSREQQRAVATALSGMLTVVSGEPGTGKTSIVVSILRALARRGDVPLESVALTAPTGKAADRMRGSIDRALRRLDNPAFDDLALVQVRPEARTLHRLLGYSPRSGRFRHHHRNRLPERFVIVDESSMVDLVLVDRLLAALRDDAQLVLIGDARQLPSVDAGAVFRDLCDRGGERAVHLSKSYRMRQEDPAGRHVLGIARLIDRGDADGCLSAGGDVEPIRQREQPSMLRFEGVELLDPGATKAREAVLARWYAAHVRSLDRLDELTQRRWRFVGGDAHPDERAELEDLFAHTEASRVLCLTRGRATGVDSVNEWFHARVLADRGLPSVRADAFLPGEPVLVQHNDYDRNLFNGDPGLVLRVRTDPRGDGAEAEAGPERADSATGLAAVFRREDGFAAFPLDAVHTLLDRAWAITVHKSQGSEYRHVAIVLPVTPTPLLGRELLYTAVTRASTSVSIVGAPAMLRTGIEARLERSSGLADRLEHDAGAGEGDPQ